MWRNTFSILFAIVFALFANSCVQDPEPSVDTKEGNFEALWKIIDQRYCYLDYKKINWDSIHTAYKNRLFYANESKEQFDLFAMMLAELKDGHVNLYSDFDQSRYWNWFSDYPDNFSSDVLYSNRYLGKNYRIAGGFRYKTLDNGKVGYMYYEDFSNMFLEANIIQIFREFENCEGLIIDVRNNGGGYLSSAEQLASYFYDKETLTGYMSYKTGKGHSDFAKPTEVKTPAHKTIHWRKKVMVLTNRMSYSATNDFVCRMKQAPNATIVGDKTGGGGGLPLSSELPNGWLVRFSACPMFDINMNHTEWGIDPDIQVELKATDEANGYDTIIEKAISLIK